MMAQADKADSSGAISTSKLAGVFHVLGPHVFFLRPIRGGGAPGDGQAGATVSCGVGPCGGRWVYGHIATIFFPEHRSCACPHRRPPRLAVVSVHLGLNRLARRPRVSKLQILPLLVSFLMDIRSFPCPDLAGPG